MSDRRTREAELVSDHGLTPAEAELAVAIAEGEACGDVVAVPGQ